MGTVIDLGFRARDWQNKTFRRLRRFSILVIHRRGGKTVQAVMKLIDAALQCTQPNGHFAYIGPQRNQAKGVAWDYIKHYATKVLGCEVNESELWVKFPNGAKVRIFGADDPNNLRGYYFDGVVVDEVAQMKREMWGEVIFPALTDRHKLDPTLGWALFIGTPRGMNLFSELYDYACLHPEEWCSQCWTVYETGVFTPVEIEGIRAQMSDGQFRQEYMCDFKASSHDILISLDDVNKAKIRQYMEMEYQGSQKRLGVDVAGFGGDATVIYCRQGLKAGPYLELRDMDTDAIADRVALAVKKTNAEIVFVDYTGIGAGVVSGLSRRRVRVQGVYSSESATDKDRFFNKRAEMWYTMAEWIKTGGSIPYDDHVLLKELTSVHYDFKNGKILIEPKEKIRETLGHSPDRADALALCFAMQDRPSSDPLGLGIVSRSFVHKNRLPGDFDPHREMNGSDTPERVQSEPFRLGGL